MYYGGRKAFTAVFACRGAPRRLQTLPRCCPQARCGRGFGRRLKLSQARINSAPIIGRRRPSLLLLGPSTASPPRRSVICRQKISPSCSSDAAQPSQLSARKAASASPRSAPDLQLEAMASRMGPRSVMDATRFTSTTPHAASKAVFAAGAAPKAGSRLAGETAEERVRRLRQAHVAAQRAQISRMDRFIDRSRRFLDVAHRWTVGGIVAFTGASLCCREWILFYFILFLICHSLPCILSCSLVRCFAACR